jgi:hypothetical protein
MHTNHYYMFDVKVLLCKLLALTGTIKHSYFTYSNLPFV